MVTGEGPSLRGGGSEEREGDRGVRVGSGGESGGGVTGKGPSLRGGGGEVREGDQGVRFKGGIAAFRADFSENSSSKYAVRSCLCHWPSLFLLLLHLSLPRQHAVLMKTGL